MTTLISFVYFQRLFPLFPNRPTIPGVFRPRSISAHDEKSSHAADRGGCFFDFCVGLLFWCLGVGQGLVLSFF